MSRPQEPVNVSGDVSEFGSHVMGEGVDVSHGPILYLDDITVSFDGFRALNKLTLTVEAGELRRNWFPYTMPFNITGHPALSICNGYDSEGLPTSLQIVGRFRDEASVLRAAALYEASESWLDRWPDL